jgi:hypothetical protein
MLLQPALDIICSADIESIQPLRKEDVNGVIFQL